MNSRGSKVAAAPQASAGHKQGEGLAAAIARRRTFAIISHPDAGKTTLTEKLLLYGSAVNEAGSVRARKNQRHATSDWMQMERDRGISITSTVLQFEYDGFQMNLLDTPGHEDFSEDTYRTLMAVDSAVMVLDAAKGIEPQTRKLFRVCRQRGIPILTFINKLDRPARDSLELLDEIRSELDLDVVAMNWPLGSGDAFIGVYDRVTRRVHLFQRGAAGGRATALEVAGVDDPRIDDLVRGDLAVRFREEIQLLDGAGSTFDGEAFRRGQQTPVFFGSALTNFGIQLFLDRFLELAPPPGPRASDAGPVQPDRDGFAGFVFKIQSNMNPQHRDSVAFLRVCAGRFERDMVVEHLRLQKSIRLSRSHRTFADERSTVEIAYPGDVIGIVNRGTLAIGDTVYSGEPVRFASIPRFAPEHFAVLHNLNASRYKQFAKGLDQLEAEGAMQVFYAPDATKRTAILGVVGQLQFDVVQFRLETEYNVATRLEVLPYSTARIVVADRVAMAGLPWAMAMKVLDHEGQVVALFSNEWNVGFWQERYKVVLNEIGEEAGQLERRGPSPDSTVSE